MKSNLNEDEILVLLNDVTITDNELSSFEFNDIEKRKLVCKVINKVKENSSKRRHISVAASLILVCLIALAGKSVIATINAEIFRDNRGIEQAVKHNYVQEVNRGIVSNSGVGIQVTHMVIDKAKFALSFDLKFDNPEILKKNLQWLNMDLEIKDDKGRIIKGYCDQDLSDKNVLGVISSSSDNFEVLNKDTGEARYNLILDSDDKNIPVLNNIDINIKTISFDFNDEQNDSLDKEITGKWQFSIDVNSKFKNNKSIFFTGENTENEIKVNSVETTQTGTVLKFTPSKNVDYKDVFKNVYLIDDKGVSKNVTGNVGSMDDKNNKSIYTVTFPITTFDNPKDLTFVIRDYYGRNVEIKLNRN
ncbi:hypothetical protein [Clostridium beijerinckii]|uniref:DUF4179 domain-containing protein n=1 Tax=Clostridium beijerinckii TaxID=1520 RepID=A0A9Q5CN88_CLOBE|nr:hypothetical protein [Clostridium beijerinckii]AQS06295.1 hypothetical protein CLBIJ_37420 [Clostridium beijerinckii]MBA2888339.1 hypothetical protein [Clostridium beijerinckii]MBA2903107.1 hypothetical protein [Clostridium beijerinckii]MBA2912931.1 hypothetical protein [Clostridium beijerinckii]MBA9014092.1 hypothetical protein [Clostridium beijerinckii]